MTVAVRVRCVRCGRQRRLAQYETLCVACTLALSREAASAYDVVRKLKDTPTPIRHGTPYEQWQQRVNVVVERTLLWIDVGHAEHQVPHVGCIFCALR